MVPTTHHASSVFLTLTQIVTLTQPALQKHQNFFTLRQFEIDHMFNIQRGQNETKFHKPQNTLISFHETYLGYIKGHTAV